MPGPNDNFLQPGMELLGSDPKRGDLYTDASGRAFRESDIPDNRPRLDGPAPSGRADADGKFSGDSHLGQARGIGGTHVRAKSLTPQQMMALADGMEQEYLDKISNIEREGPSARRLAGGSSENGFNTELTQGAEKAFSHWSPARGDDGSDYDYRGAFAGGAGRGSDGHMTDQYKKPNHPTFSDESQYSSEGSPGHWSGDRFEPSAAQVGVPDWLHQYMSRQAPTDPYHQVPMSGLDMVKQNKYLSEQERLRYIKSLRK